MNTNIICEKECHLCNIEQFINEEWLSYLLKEINKPYFNKIKALLHQKPFFPKPNKVFLFTKLPLQKIKVVILGQDPYHGTNQAMGLSFSVTKETKIPPSLRNIYKEIKCCYDDFESKDGDLTKWFDQGVLLLNSILTVEHNKPNSHKKIGWMNFTDEVLKIINDNCKNVVFMLWGNFAIKKKVLIDVNKHLVLTAAHPSPFSALRGFLGCKHFILANEYLEKKSD